MRAKLFLKIDLFFYGTISDFDNIISDNDKTYLLHKRVDAHPLLALLLGCTKSSKSWHIKTVNTIPTVRSSTPGTLSTSSKIDLLF